MRVMELVGGQWRLLRHHLWSLLPVHCFHDVSCPKLRRHGDFYASRLYRYVDAAQIMRVKTAHVIYNSSYEVGTARTTILESVVRISQSIHGFLVHAKRLSSPHGDEFQSGAMLLLYSTQIL